MLCHRCHGLMIPDLYLEHYTKCKPAFYCVNCGSRVDIIIQRNQHYEAAKLYDLVQYKKKRAALLRLEGVA